MGGAWENHKVVTQEVYRGVNSPGRPPVSDGRSHHYLLNPRCGGRSREGKETGKKTYRAALT